MRQVQLPRELCSSSLKSGKSHIIALVVPDSENPFFSRILHSLRVKSIPMGYECMLVETASSNTWCDCMEDSLLGGETACAVSLCNNLEAVSRAIERSIISVGDEKEGSKCIIIDFKTALREAVSLLTGAGYENILYLRSINDSPGVVRVEAFNDACRKTGISHGLISATGHIENDVLLLYSN